MGQRKTVIVDAMSGDNAPGEVVKGAVAGAAACGCRLVLVGDILTKAKDNNIAEANNKISSAKTRYDEAVSKLEEKRKEQSDRAWDLTLNSLNRIRNCNISSFGDTAHATCY